MNLTGKQYAELMPEHNGGAWTVLTDVNHGTERHMILENERWMLALIIDRPTGLLLDTVWNKKGDA